MMRLKVQQVFDATQVLAAIINEKRPLPTKGVYRVTRMHAKLFPEFNTVNEQRTAKISAYEHQRAVYAAGVVVPPELVEDALAKGLATMQAAVPDDKMPEFVSWWNEIAGEEIEVGIDPIPLDQLCIDGQEASISFAEFTVLGDLVAG